MISLSFYVISYDYDIICTYHMKCTLANDIIYLHQWYHMYRMSYSPCTMSCYWYHRRYHQYLWHIMCSYDIMSSLHKVDHLRCYYGQNNERCVLGVTFYSEDVSDANFFLQQPAWFLFFSKMLQRPFPWELASLGTIVILLRKLLSTFCAAEVVLLSSPGGGGHWGSCGVRVCRDPQGITAGLAKKFQAFWFLRNPTWRA
jgi:hypothetical protein